MIQNIFTVDVEEWSDRIALQPWTNVPTSTVLPGVTVLLKLLKQHRSTGTFFVLGKVATQHPELLEIIQHYDCEVASHGYSHKQLHELDPATFAYELDSTARAIKRTIGESPLGFRAPRFSLNHKTAWALKVLEEKNYLYDSSIYPASTGFYGSSRAPTTPYSPSKSNPLRAYKGRLKEFPLLVHQIGSIRIPVKLRHCGCRFTAHAIRTMNKHQSPATFLVHSWEVAPPPKGHRALIRNFGIPCTSKVKHLLKHFSFTSVRAWLE